MKNRHNLAYNTNSHAKIVNNLIPFLLSNYFLINEYF